MAHFGSLARQGFGSFLERWYCKMRRQAGPCEQGPLLTAEGLLSLVGMPSQREAQISLLPPMGDRAQHRAVEIRLMKLGPWLKPHLGSREKSQAQAGSPTSTNHIKLWFSPGQVQVAVDTVFSRDPEKVSLH